jgi:serine protease Do
MSATTRRVVGGIGFVVAVTVAATGIDLIRDGVAQPVPSDTQQATQTATREPVATDPGVVQALSAAFRNAAQMTLPAVVSIEVEAVREQTARTPFQLPFGFEDSRDPMPSRGFGTGFVFRSDGYILTNNHVVADAQRVTVRFQDRSQAQATVVGRDPNSDVAVVKVDRTDLPTVNLGNSDQTMVGDWVVALGFPLNFQGTATVTAGIVSAKGRNLDILARNGASREAIEQFIQTDAAINPGNSGGPLIDLNGNVIGINSAIASPTGYFSGYGFAIPINIARSMAEDLIRYGEVRRPQLGVGVRNVSDDDRDALHLPGLAGALVSEITPGKPAEEAGLELGDVIVRVDNARIDESGQLIELLNNQYDPGDRIAIEVIREGKEHTFNVTLDTFEPAVAASDRPRARDTRGVSRLGFRVADLTPQIARSLNIDAREGVVVTEIDPRGPAVVPGGTLIEEVNGQEIKSVADLEEIANGLDSGDVVSLIVVRPDTGTRTIVNYRLR